MCAESAACNWWYTCERCSKLCQPLSSIIMPTVCENTASCAPGMYNNVNDIILTFPLHTLHCISMIHCMSPLQLHRWHSPSAGILFLSIRIAISHKITCCHNAGRGAAWNGGLTLTTKWQEFDFLIFSGKCNMNLKHRWKLQWIIVKLRQRSPKRTIGYIFL